MMVSHFSQAKMKNIGWWYFEVPVPEDWDIAAQGKTRDVEVFRLADSYAVRMEVTLEKMPFEKAKTADQLYDAFKKNWERRLAEIRRKEGIEAELKHISKEYVNVKGHRGICWVFRVSNATMIAAVWYCEKSERAITLSYTTRSPDDERIFHSMLKGVKCHYDTASERALWSTLLFDIRIAQKYQLAAAKFTATSSFCLFVEPDSLEYLVVGYSGLASILFNKYRKGLREWFEKEILKDIQKNSQIKLPKIKYEEISATELTFNGETFSLSKTKKKIILGKIWLDKEMDRIIVTGVYFSATKRKESEELLNEIVDQLHLTRKI
ncbi:MAG: hypothetical protein N3E41_04135 [Thermofilaceae archaeon]|nr:hypothetical protein [Thermofilaceae archaeon]